MSVYGNNQRTGALAFLQKEEPLIIILFSSSSIFSQAAKYFPTQHLCHSNQDSLEMESSCQTCRQASVVEPYQNADGLGPLKAVSTRPAASPPARSIQLEESPD